MEQDQAKASVAQKAAAWTEAYGGLIKLVMVGMSATVTVLVSFAWNSLIQHSLDMREIKGQLVAVTAMRADIAFLNDRLRQIEASIATLEERSKANQSQIDHYRRSLDDLNRALRERGAQR